MNGEEMADGTAMIPVNVPAGTRFTCVELDNAAGMGSGVMMGMRTRALATARLRPVLAKRTVVVEQVAQGQDREIRDHPTQDQGFTAFASHFGMLPTNRMPLDAPYGHARILTPVSTASTSKRFARISW
jgi:hypothetical protein